MVQETIPIAILIANNEKYVGLLKSTEKRLNDMGLKRGTDYEFFGMPPSIEKNYFPINVRVSKDNSLKLEPERFFGKRGLVQFIREVKGRSAA